MSKLITTFRDDFEYFELGFFGEFTLLLGTFNPLFIRFCVLQGVFNEVRALENSIYFGYLLEDGVFIEVLER